MLICFRSGKFFRHHAFLLENFFPELVNQAPNR
jgi:hypothetical protein